MKRLFGLDLLRTIAVIMVLGVHFFLNTNFYDMKINGIISFLSIIFRWFFYIGVPLFIILTGYLKNNKELNKDYYKGIKKILISYFFISIICIVFKKYCLNQETRLLKLFLGIFNFTTLEYAWYIEMYIGLFLLIPFLNIMYKGLETKKNKQILILTLIILVSLNPLINYCKIKGVTLEIIPDWWSKIYPLLYYFIGCYISEYKCHINKLKGIIIIVVLVLLASIFSYIYAYNSTFNIYFLGGYGSLQTVIISTVMFLLLYDVNCNKEKVKKVVTKISYLSLNIYLFSYITDIIVYDKLRKLVGNSNTYLLYFIPTVIITFALSFLLSYLKEMIFKKTHKLKT